MDGGSGGSTTKVFDGGGTRGGGILTGPSTGRKSGPSTGGPTIPPVPPKTGVNLPGPATPPGASAPASRGGSATFKRATTGGASDWSAWWNWNSEPYLRSGLVASFAATPGPADVASCDLTPKLASLLVAEDPRLVADGLLALARATPPAQAERVAALVRKRLDDEQLLVRE